MNNFTYWKSQSYRTLNHWQSGEQAKYYTISTRDVYMLYESYNQSTNTYSGKVWGAPGLKYPGASLALNGQCYSVPFDFSLLKFKQGKTYSPEEGINVYGGSFVYPSQKLEVVPVLYTGTDTPKFYGSYVTDGSDARNWEEMSVPSRIGFVPTITPVVFCYMWCKDGLTGSTPAWFLNELDSFESYTPTTSAGEYAGWKPYARTNIGTGDPFVQQIYKGLYEAVSFGDNEEFHKMNIPVGYSVNSSGIDIGEAVKPTEDGTITPSTYVYGGIHGINTTSSPYIETSTSDTRPSDETYFTLSGVGESLFGGYRQVSDEYIKPLGLSLRGIVTQEPLLNVGGFCDTWRHEQTGAYFEESSVTSQGDAINVGYLRDFMSVSWYNEDGEQTGAFYMCLSPFVSKLDVEEVTYYQKGTV